MRSKVQRASCARSTAPFSDRRPSRDGRKRNRDQRIVAGERKSEKAPSCLVAAHHADRPELVGEMAGGAEIAGRPRAFLRPRPPSPFDAGMIGAKRRVPEHSGGDGDERADEHLARRAGSVAERDQASERHREIIGITLLETERAGSKPEHVLEEPGADNRGGAHGCNGDRSRESRAGCDHAAIWLRHCALVSRFRSLPKYRAQTCMAQTWRWHGDGPMLTPYPAPL